jgi:hypothetical protein
MHVDHDREGGEGTLACPQSTVVGVGHTATVEQFFWLLVILFNSSLWGRAFLHGLRRLRFRAAGVLRAARHRVHVNLALKEDMRWWNENLELRNGDKLVPIVAHGLPHERCEAYLDARGGSGGVGVFLDGGFVAFTGSECNKLYPTLSPGVTRCVGGGREALPSSEANHWELFVSWLCWIVFPMCYGIGLLWLGLTA